MYAYVLGLLSLWRDYFHVQVWCHVCCVYSSQENCPEFACIESGLNSHTDWSGLSNKLENFPMENSKSLNVQCTCALLKKGQTAKNWLV